MAKVEFVTTPKAAYEWAEVTGGGSMSDAQRAALLDEFIEEHGLVPVEAAFRGETPIHKYGRYKAAFAVASALPTALPNRESDLNKANEERDALRAENARLLAQLGKAKGAKMADDDDAIDNQRGDSSGGPQTTDDARAALSESLPGDQTVGTSSDPRRNVADNDKSDDNPPAKAKPGPKPKA